MGIYNIVYEAEDSSGNRSSITIRLHILDEGEQIPDDYPEMDEAALAAIKNANVNARNEITIVKNIESFNDSAYYSSLNNKTGEAFFNEMVVILNNYTKVSYGDARFILEISDQKDSVFGTYLYGIYDGKKLIRYWNSSGPIQREHVWPQSYLTAEAENSKKNIASDLHNLRAINGPTNGSRGNRYFVNGELGNIANQLVGNDAYYPGDDHRGDVARIMFYMHVMYNQELYLSNNIQAIKNKTLDSNGRIPFGLLDILLQWHFEDLPDDFEIQRNDVIYQYQGNRNPFIDHPEFVTVIWGYEGNDGQMEYVAVTFVNTDLNLGDFKQREEWFA